MTALEIVGELKILCQGQVMRQTIGASSPPHHAAAGQWSVSEFVGSLLSILKDTSAKKLRGYRLCSGWNKLFLKGQHVDFST